MGKPAFRDYDESPKRVDDIRIKGFGIELEANGRIVILFLISMAALGVAIWGVISNEKAHAAMLRAFELQTCILTLNEQERREYRENGRYCARSFQFSNGRDERNRYMRGEQT